MLIDGTGRIAAIGPRDSVGHPPGAAVLDFGSAILLPGLVNTHTHLELTGFQATASSAERKSGTTSTDICAEESSQKYVLM